MKKIKITFSSLMLVGTAYAEDTSVQTFWSDPINYKDSKLYLTIGFVFLVFLVALAVAIVVIRAFRIVTGQVIREREEASGKVYVAAPSFWSSFTKRVNDSVPLEREQDIDLGHSYDGIRELDNHLPPWWKWLFIGTIGWAGVYFFVFHISSSLPLQQQEYDNELAAAESQKQKLLSSQPQLAIDIEKLEFKNDPAIISNGKKVFSSINCGSCHRPDGGGNTIGPNLTDKYWLHGGDIKSVFNTINGGVLEKGMPAWGKSLSQVEVRDVTFYILSLQGSNPKDAKAAQGELFKEELLKKDSLTATVMLEGSK